jgi:hypothetical protein
LGFQRQQLAAKRGNARARYFGEPSVIASATTRGAECHCIGDNFEQPLDATAPNRRHDPELGKMRAD